MASVDVSQLSKQEHDELVCAYSALLLHDDGLEISVSSRSSASSQLLLTPAFLTPLSQKLNHFFRARKSLRLSRPAVMKLKLTGPHCSLRHSGDKISKIYWQTWLPPPLEVLPPLSLKPPLLPKLLPRVLNIFFRVLGLTLSFSWGEGRRGGQCWHGRTFRWWLLSTLSYSKVLRPESGLARDQCIANLNWLNLQNMSDSFYYLLFLKL